MMYARLSESRVNSDGVKTIIRRPMRIELLTFFILQPLPCRLRPQFFAVADDFNRAVLVGTVNDYAAVAQVRERFFGGVMRAVIRADRNDGELRRERL